MQARKVAWAFCDAVSLVEQPAARDELVSQFARRMRVIEHQVDWYSVLERTMTQCLEERAKEKQKADAAERDAAAAKGAG